MAQLRAFCGDGCTFLTWGYDDKGILEQNIIIHNLDWDWIAKWINLQLIYSIQTEGDRNQKSLASAMEHFQIPQTRTAHDALGDAYNTAVVCSHLDMETGLAQYDDTTRALPVRMSGAGPGQQGAEPLEHSAFSGFHDRMEPFDDPAVTHLPCPQCGGETSHTKWVSQGDRRYMALYECPKHGHYLMRLKLRQSEDGTWGVNRILYKADEKMEQYFTAKSTTRRRRRRRRKKKS